MRVKKHRGASFEIDVKRFYVPFSVFDQCPKCGAESEVDLGNDYLSFPSIGEPERVCFYCEHCDDEWTGSVVLGLTLKAAKEQ